MKRGTIATLIILVVAVTAGVIAVWYRFEHQQQAQAFWGTETALLIDRAPQIDVLAIGDANRRIVLDTEDDFSEPEEVKKDAPDVEAEALPQAVEFNQVPWIIARTKSGAEAKGLANLRRSLVEDTTFDWTEPEEAEEPVWHYGLAINDGRNWATVLFDVDSRQVGLAGGNKTARLRPEMNDEFREFFTEQLAESEEKGDDAVDDKTAGDNASAEDGKTKEAPEAASDGPPQPE